MIKMHNILAVVAHPDDLELMAAGTIIRAISDGCNVHVLTFSDGSWYNPQGELERSKIDAAKEEAEVANFIGYSFENLGLETLHLSYNDKNVVEVLKRIEQYKIDTIICPYSKDLHHDHQVVSRIAISASRKIPNILMGQINYYLNEFFVPNFFVDISDSWDKKIEAMQLYKSQWNNSQQDWYDFLDSTSRYYGKIIGVERAEGFYSNKLTYK